LQIILCQTSFVGIYGKGELLGVRISVGLGIEFWTYQSGPGIGYHFKTFILALPTTWVPVWSSYGIQDQPFFFIAENLPKSEIQNSKKCDSKGFQSPYVKGGVGKRK
jgi:hypothetical protein